MLRETECLHSYRLGLRPTAVRPPCTLSVSAQFWHGLQVSWSEQKPSFENSVHICWRCCVDKPLQVSQFWNSIRILVEFLPQSRFVRLRKLAKATMSFVLSVCLSVRPPARMEQGSCQWTDFHEMWYSNIFRKSVERIKVSLKFDSSYYYYYYYYYIYF
jgi:hypothetical protein